MSTAAPTTSPAPAPASASLAKRLGLLGALVALLAVLALPTPAGLPVAGQTMLAILAFAVIVWMTEALEYSVSAVVIAALFAACPEIRAVFFNGQAAWTLYHRLCPELGGGAARTRLPSTSPAYTMPFEQKLAAWRVVRLAVEGEEKSI